MSLPKPGIQFLRTLRPIAWTAMSLCLILRKPATPSEASHAMLNFVGLPQKLGLPSAPTNPIVERSEEDRPQTRLDVDEGNGMSVSVGRIRKDEALHGLKYVVLGHNLMRGG